MQVLVRGTDDSIYVCGGTINGIVSNRAFRLDPRENKWTALPNLLESRNTHSFINYDNNRLFALGNTSNRIEYYDIRSNKWSYPSPLSTILQFTADRAVVLY